MHTSISIKTICMFGFNKWPQVPGNVCRDPVAMKISIILFFTVGWNVFGSHWTVAVLHQRHFITKHHHAPFIEKACCALAAVGK